MTRRSTGLQIPLVLRLLIVLLAVTGAVTVAATPDVLKGFGSDLSGQLGVGHQVNSHLPWITYSSVTNPIHVRNGVRAVSTGRAHTLYVQSDGTLWVVGNNTFGQLGDGGQLHRWEPLKIDTSVTAVAAGQGHSLFVKADGSLWAMGNNGYGQLGDGTTTERRTPVKVATDVAMVAAGRGQSFFIKTDGSLWGMGDNSKGQLGITSQVDQHTPVRITADAVFVVTGDDHCLFVKRDFSLWGMGSNQIGQLGGGPSENKKTPFLISQNVKTAAAGQWTSYFVTTDNTLWGMGYNNGGQLGDGTRDSRTVPIRIGSDVDLVSAGAASAMFIKTDRTLWGVGTNSLGQLGDGTDWERTKPVQITSSVAAVASSGYQTLFIKNDGTLWGMGDDSDGQLADGTADERWAPVTIANDVISMNAGNGTTHFVRSDHTLWAAGVKGGILGDGTTEQRSRPVFVASDVASVAPGSGSHMLFIKQDSSLWGAGANHSGQLGVGTDTLAPQPVLIDKDVVSAAVGGDHSIYLKKDGTVWTMGYNLYGQLGDGSTGSRSRPVQIAKNAVAVAAGDNNSFFISSTGVLWGTGSNIGTPDRSKRHFPFPIATNVISVSPGSDHTFLVKSDNTLWAMGSNGSGEYDNGTFSYREWNIQQSSPSTVPFQIASDVVAASCDYHRSFYITRDGTLWASGFNSDSQLGDPTTIGSSRPTAVPIATGVSAVSAGDYHTLILNGDHSGAAPALSAPSGIVIYGGQTPTVWSIKVKDADTPEHLLTVSATSSDTSLLPESGLVFGGSGRDRTLEVRPAPNRHGLAKVTITVSDGRLSEKREFTVDVYPARGEGTMFTGRSRTYWSRAGDTTILTTSSTGVIQRPFQWLLSTDGGSSWVNLVDNDTYEGSTSPGLRIRSSMAVNGYMFALSASNGLDQIISAPTKLVVEDTPRLVNISTRAFCGDGDKVTIGGVVVSGKEPKQVLVRAIGPSLIAGGIPSSEILEDPLLEVYDANNNNVVFASNDNWGSNTNIADINAVGKRVGAGALASNDVASSALLVTLPAGIYTCVVRGRNGAGGLVLLEMFDADPPGSKSRLLNLSSRAFSGPGSNVTIGGFVVAGSMSQSVILRAVGETLVGPNFGVADVLPNPRIELYRGNVLIAVAEGKDDYGNEAAVLSTSARVGASPIGQNDHTSAVLLTTLAPGVYTFIAKDQQNKAGIVLVEIYDVD